MKLQKNQKVCNSNIKIPETQAISRMLCLLEKIMNSRKSYYPATSINLHLSSATHKPMDVIKINLPRMKPLWETMSKVFLAFLMFFVLFCCDSMLKPSAQLNAAKLNKRVASATSSFNSFSTVNAFCFMMVEHLIHPGSYKHLLFSLTDQDEMTRNWQ